MFFNPVIVYPCASLYTGVDKMGTDMESLMQFPSFVFYLGKQEREWEKRYQ